MYEFAFRLDPDTVKAPKKIKIDKLEKALIKKAKYLNMPLADTVIELKKIRELENNPKGWEQARLDAAKNHPAVLWLEAMNILYELALDRRELPPDRVLGQHLIALGVPQTNIPREVFLVKIGNKSTAAWFKLTWSEYFV